MSRRDARTREATTLVYGGVPRASLMPPEVGLRQRETARRRWLISLVVVVLLLVVAGIFGSYTVAAQAEQRLAEERLLTEELLATQLQYSEVVQLQAQVESITGQRLSLAETEILWRDTLTPYIAVLAGEGTITQLSASNAGPFAPPLGLQGPLRTPRVATVQLFVSTPGLPPAGAWMEALAQVDTYADASIDSVVQEDDTYVTVITLNLTGEALSARFAAEEVNS